jgi:hypothetical protein
MFVSKSVVYGKQSSSSLEIGVIQQHVVAGQDQQRRKSSAAQLSPILSDEKDDNAVQQWEQQEANNDDDEEPEDDGRKRSRGESLGIHLMEVPSYLSELDLMTISESDLFPPIARPEQYDSPTDDEGGHSLSDSNPFRAPQQNAK